MTSCGTEDVWHQVNVRTGCPLYWWNLIMCISMKEILIFCVCFRFTCNLFLFIYNGCSKLSKSPSICFSRWNVRFSHWWRCPCSHSLPHVYVLSSFLSDIWALGCVLYEMCTLKHAVSTKAVHDGLFARVLNRPAQLIDNVLSSRYPLVWSGYLQKRHKMR